MQDFLSSILAFPTVGFTGLLGLVLLYWLTVLLGFLDLDFLDLDLDADPGGSLDGAAEGALEGAGEGGVGDADAEAPGGLAGLIHALGLAGVPLTVSGSLVTLVSWVASYLAMEGLAALVPGLASSLPVQLGVGLVALAAGVFVASRTVRPLRPLFATQQAVRRSQFVGQLCTVTTLRVTEDFGQAEIEDGGAGQLAQVRCREANELTRGAKALIFDYDPDDEVYHVVPADRALAGG